MEAVDGQNNVVLLRIVGGIATFCVPALGWLAKYVFGLQSRVVKVETILGERMPQLEDLRKSQASDGYRLVRVEEAVEKLAQMQKTSQQNYADLQTKLEILPRIDESLKYLARVCATIVPREEWELNNRQYDERLKRAEGVKR